MSRISWAVLGWLSPILVTPPSPGCAVQQCGISGWKEARGHSQAGTAQSLAAGCPQGKFLLPRALLPTSSIFHLPGTESPFRMCHAPCPQVPCWPRCGDISLAGIGMLTVIRIQREGGTQCNPSGGGDREQHRAAGMNRKGLPLPSIPQPINQWPGSGNEAARPRRSAPYCHAARTAGLRKNKWPCGAGDTVLVPQQSHARYACDAKLGAGIPFGCR